MASLAKLRCKPPAHWKAAIVHELCIGAHTFDGRDLSQLMSAMAKLYGHTSAFDAALDHAADQATRLWQSGGLTMRHAALVLWALAKMGYYSDSVQRFCQVLSLSIVQEVRRTRSCPHC